MKPTRYGAWLRGGLVLLALFLLGYGSWIPLKAQVAQWLLEDAWESRLRHGAMTVAAARDAAGHHAAAPDAASSCATVRYATAWVPNAGERSWHPWPWADMTPVGRLSAPEVGGDWIVVSGSGARNLAFAPTWIEGSAVPGSAGLSVIAVHKDTHFAVLANMRVVLVLYWTDAQARLWRYVVRAVAVVDSRDNAIPLGAARHRPALLLVTCYPFDASHGGPLRWVVLAEVLGATL